MPKLKTAFWRKRVRQSWGETGKLSSSSLTIELGAATAAVPITPPAEQSVAVAVNNGATLGLQVVGGPPQQDAIVDIIFVHGLTGNGHGTWLDAKTGVHWPSGLLTQDIPDARIFCFGYDADVTSFWGHSSRNRLAEHAKTLLGDVVHEREDTDTQSRKIIFVAHSLGGLVVEKALCLSRSHSEARSQQLERHTVGIVFLGTPHHGSDLAAWATVCARLMKKFKDANPEILNVLRPESEVLRDTQDQFGQLLESRKDEGSKINITCFYEELAMFVVGQVVSTSSACLLGYDSYGIHADHDGITRFSTRSDMGYKRVIGEIKRSVRPLRPTTRPRVTTNEASVSTVSTVSTEAHEECLRSLYYEDMFFRQDTVPKACPRTFEWIWYKDDLGFREWLRAGRGHGSFWISGKPGSGKSTLLKYLSSDTVRITEELSGTCSKSRGIVNRPIIATHFFQHGVGPLANSIEGLLRSLMWQMLLKDPSLSQPVISILSDMKRATGSVVWSRQQLEAGFRCLLRKFSEQPLLIFIDALDEYNGEDAEIASFLDTLAKEAPPNVRFCMTSRPYPDFAFQFVDAPTFRVHDHTDEDIRIFVQLNFQELLLRPGHSTYLELMTDTREKADGVFLWVKLVCDELRRGWRRFDTAAKLHQCLKMMPKDLDSMYRRIFSDMRSDDRDEACRMLAVAMSAARPLSVIEFYHALVYSTATCKKGTRGSTKTINTRSDALLQPLQLYLPDGLLFDLDAKGDSPQYANLGTVLEGRIDAICRGILQVHNNRVRLLHETVETFFRGAAEWLVQSSFKLASLYGDELLLRACINYQIALIECNPPLKWSTKSSNICNHEEDMSLNALQVNGADYPEYYRTHCWDRRENVPLRLSFLFYAVDNWLDHACKAETATQRAQDALLETFSGHSFIVWQRLFRIHNPGRRRALPQRLLDIIIESGLNLTADAVLQDAAKGNGNELTRELVRPQSRNRLLFSVAKGGSYVVAKSIFDLGVTFRRPAGHRVSFGIFKPAVSIPNEIALHRAIYFNHPAIVDLFIREGADMEAEVDSKELDDSPNIDERAGGTVLRERGDNPQSAFSSHGSLQRSNARRKSFLRVTREGKIWASRPLEFAVLCDKTESFLTLLSFYSEGERHESLHLALTAAAFKGRTNHVRALLDHGIDPNIPARRTQGCFILGTHTCYAILPAVYWGYTDIVELLIARGADLNVQADCEAYGLSLPGKRSYAGRPGTPLSVARDRSRLYPSNQTYLQMVSMLENSGAYAINDNVRISTVVEGLND